MSEEDKDGLTIVLDNEPQYFLAGESVAGRLIVNSKKGVKTEGLSMTFHGEIHIAITGSLVGEDKSKIYRDDEIIVNLTEDLLSGTQEIPPGRHTFPFSFDIPQGISSSYEHTLHGLDGRVKYCLKARLEQSWAIDWTHEKVIPVKGLLDLRQYPGLNQPAEFYKEKTFGCLCCTSRPFKTWCNLEKTGFYPGEEIGFKVRLENGSGKEVLALKAELNQTFMFCAIRVERSISNKVAEVFREENLPNSASPTGEDFWEGELLVPLCDPTGLGAQNTRSAHQLINLRYTLDIIAQVSGCCTSPPQVSCDVTIGLRPEDMESETP